MRKTVLVVAVLVCGCGSMLWPGREGPDVTEDAAPAQPPGDRIGPVEDAADVVALDSGGPREEDGEADAGPGEDLHAADRGSDPDSGVHCLPEGLFVDGILAVPSDPMVDAAAPCTTSSLHLHADGGYEACCDKSCCAWDPEAGEETMLVGAGRPCEAATQCVFGLSCLAGDEGNYVCANGDEGDPCSDEALCRPGYLCGALGVCMAPATQEGASCIAHPALCAWPLACVCLPGGDCACYDGSTGDPCLSSTCATGLYCSVGGGVSGVCLEGKQGDPCQAEWQCDSGFSCAEFMGATVCAQVVSQGAACGAAAGAAVTCGAGLVCNAALLPAVCLPPGKDAGPCVEEGDCAEGWGCVASAGQCWSGLAGHPCDDETGCGQGLDCTEVGEASVCVHFYIVGVPCGLFTSPYHLCAEGLMCNQALQPAACAEAGAAGAACAEDANCLAPAQCVKKLATCFDGTNGDPCPDGEPCGPGHECISGLEVCTNGLVGAPCAGDLDCAGSLACVWQQEGSACVQILEEGEPCEAVAAGLALCGPGLACGVNAAKPACTPAEGSGAESQEDGEPDEAGAGEGEEEGDEPGTPEEAEGTP